MRRRIALTIVVVTVLLQVSAQSSLILSQRVKYNELINPAALGKTEEITLLTSYKHVKLAIDGAPSLLNINLRVPVNSFVGVAVTAETESMGLRRELKVAAAGDISVNLAQGHVFTAALTFGVTSRNFQPIDDPLEGGMNDVDVSMFDRTFALWGFGLNYKGAGLSLGAGATLINRNDLELQADNFSSIYLHAAYDFELPEEFTLTPRMILENNSDFGFVADIGLFAQYDHYASVGVIYRPNKIVGASVSFDMLKYVTINYICDFNVGKFANLYGTSHEIALRATIPTGSKRKPIAITHY